MCFGLLPHVDFTVALLNVKDGSKFYSNPDRIENLFLSRQRSGCDVLLIMSVFFVPFIKGIDRFASLSTTCKTAVQVRTNRQSVRPAGELWRAVTNYPPTVRPSLPSCVLARCRSAVCPRLSRYPVSDLFARW